MKYALATSLCAALTAALASAQFADWNTAGFDAQRSNWLRTDTKISLESMRTPGFELVWKSKVIPEGQAQRLAPPVLLDFYISYRGFRSLAFVGGSGNSVVAYDADLGRVEWRKDFKVEGGVAARTAACPGGMTAPLSRPAVVGYPPSTGAGGRGRGTAAKSGVGEPFEGAVTLRRDTPRPQQPPQVKSDANLARRVAVPQSQFAPRVQLVHALTADGKLHSMYVSNGEEPKPAVSFVPANAHAKGLLVVDNVAYVATVNGCGGVENGLWALDLQSHKVAHWKSDASVAGTSALAATPDGIIFAAAGGELVALEPRTLARKGASSIVNQVFTSSPVVMDMGGKDFIAAASNDGKIHVFDSGSFGAPVASTPAFVDGKGAPTALASWVDSGGARWILAPIAGKPLVGGGPTGDASNGGIVAWKLFNRAGATSLELGWVSRDLTLPPAPIVVNGVVFALSRGGGTGAPATLYAFDSSTGKELWNSGRTITGPVNVDGLSAGGSRVYVASEDGTQYVFGFPIEH
ncbi:MAG TPA: hypothetical protein VER03_07865 [Bryobacteraceae bacterium]|nr:hypothetical protein [Bryobacteraceae bacterium]